MTQEASANLRNTGGREFITAFLQNYQPGYVKGNLFLALTSLSSNTSGVTIFSEADGRTQKIMLKSGESVMIHIGASSEMIGSNLFQHTVFIDSQYDISVQAINSRPNTGEITLLWPVSALGTEYFVFTPPSTLTKNVKEFAVVAGLDPVSVNIRLKGAVTFQSKLYPAGNVLSISLHPGQGPDTEHS